MNAEFLEQKIVVTTETVEGETVTTITPAKVRKGLHPGSFIGAEVKMIADGNLTHACSVVSASDLDGKVVLDIPGADEEGTIEYDPETGELEITEASGGEELKIVIEVTEPNGNPTITPTEIQAGLAAKDFVGVMVEYRFLNHVNSAMITSVDDQGTGYMETSVSFGAVAGDTFLIDYNSGTGELAVTKLST